MITSTTKRDLEKTRELLADTKNWVQGVMRTDRFGVATSAGDKTKCRCLMAAMYDAVGGRGTLERRERVDAMEAAVSPFFTQCSIPRFNDDPETTHTDILYVLDQGIAS